MSAVIHLRTWHTFVVFLYAPRESARIRSRETSWFLPDLDRGRLGRRKGRIVRCASLICVSTDSVLPSEAIPDLSRSGPRAGARLIVLVKSARVGERGFDSLKSKRRSVAHQSGRVACARLSSYHLPMVRSRASLETTVESLSISKSLSRPSVAPPPVRLDRSITRFGCSLNAPRPVCPPPASSRSRS